jgi:molecular chaperone GrpE (heat shock protein)
LDSIAHVRSSAAEVLRSAAQARRQADQTLGRRTEELLAVVRAAVESLETLGHTVDAYLPQLDETARQTIHLAGTAAWERLARAGITLDGVVGESVDLTRHRVARRRRSGGPDGSVLDVLSPGILFQEKRVREALVCVSHGVEGDAANRD